MKSIIRYIFISIIIHPNFMHLHKNLNFKSALESFASVSGLLRNSLKSLILMDVIKWFAVHALWLFLITLQKNFCSLVKPMKHLFSAITLFSRPDNQIFLGQSLSFVYKIYNSRKWKFMLMYEPISGRKTIH